MTGGHAGEFVDPLGRGGFARQRKKGSGALVAAIAVHLGVAGAVMMMPGVEIIKRKDKPIWGTEVPVPRPPEPETEVEPATRPPIATTRPEPRIVAPPPTIPIGGAGEPIGTAGGGDSLTGGDDAIVLRDPPVDPPQPVLTGARMNPRFASRFQPDYPPGLLRLGTEGSVTVRVSIDEQGRVIAVTLVRTDDPAFFETTRRHALRDWRFLPAIRDGQPVASSREMTVHFRITGQ